MLKRQEAREAEKAAAQEALDRARAAAAAAPPPRGAAAAAADEAEERGPVAWPGPKSGPGPPPPRPVPIALALAAARPGCVSVAGPDARAAALVSEKCRSRLLGVEVGHRAEQPLLPISRGVGHQVKRPAVHRTRGRSGGIRRRRARAAF